MGSICGLSFGVFWQVYFQVFLRKYVPKVAHSTGIPPCVYWECTASLHHRGIVSAWQSCLTIFF